VNVERRTSNFERRSEEVEPRRRGKIKFWILNFKFWMEEEEVPSDQNAVAACSGAGECEAWLAWPEQSGGNAMAACSGAGECEAWLAWPERSGGNFGVSVFRCFGVSVFRCFGVSVLRKGQPLRTDPFALQLPTY